MVAFEDSDLLQGDEALAERIRAGDRRAEDELVQLYFGRTFAMMLVRTRDREAARELTDDVLMATVTALRAAEIANRFIKSLPYIETKNLYSATIEILAATFRASN